MLICNSCGRENEEEFKFCLGCGASLNKPAPAPVVEAPASNEPVMVDCGQCGTSVPSNFKFCGSCGSPIQRAPLAPEPVDSEAEDFFAQANEASPEPPTARVLGRLTVIRPDGSEGATIELSDKAVVLGRETGIDALANDPFLSPKHALVGFENGGFFVDDQGSLNGVFIRVREEVELQDGDEIRIGQELLNFELIDPAKSKEPSNGKARRGGSPDPGAWARLSLVAGPELTSRAFMCVTDEVTIGREIGAILFRDDGFVSGKHARIIRQDGKIFLRDLGSSNGTYLRIREPRKAIARGDLILMGQQLFRLHS